MTTSNQRDWRSRAACRDVDPETFFPVAESGPAYERQVAAAKAVCTGCPVRSECLNEALVRVPEGVAGGLTPVERRRLGRRSVRPATGGELVQDARSRAEVAAAGSVLIAAGRSTQAVAEECGVTERTVYRWRAAAVATSARTVA